MRCLTVQLRKTGDEVDFFSNFVLMLKNEALWFLTEIEKIFQMSSNATIGIKVLALKTLLYIFHKKTGESNEFVNIVLLWLAVSGTPLDCKSGKDICLKHVSCQKHNIAHWTLETTSFEKITEKNIICQTFWLCCIIAYLKLISRKKCQNSRNCISFIILMILTAIRLGLKRKG